MLLSPDFAANDLGFLDQGEQFDLGGRVAYQEIEPGSVFRSWNVSLLAFNDMGMTECMTPPLTVVGFDSGGIGEMVEPGVTGWLAPSGDVNALAEALREALSAEAGRGAMGEAGRARAVSVYDLSVQARACRQLYEQVLAGRAAASLAAAAAPAEEHRGAALRQVG